MSNKKIHSIVLAGIMLISFLAVMPAVHAEGEAKGVKGILYANNEIPTSDSHNFEQILVKLEFPADKAYSEEIYEYKSKSDSTNYYIGFWGHEGETADIVVWYYGYEIIPDDNITITINESIGYIMDVHINTTGLDITPPSKVTGLSVTDAKDGELDLSWDAATDDTGIDHYNIYRDGVKLADEPSGTSYQDTGLNNGQEYCYQVSAVDNCPQSWEGEKSDEKCATPTKTQTTGGGGTPIGGGGSGGDDTTTDDDDEDDGGDEVIPNNPPVIIEFTGNQTGSKETAISYSATATDPDGHDIKYIFGWEDGTNDNETDFMANGTQYTITHTFTSAGIYNIWVYAIDDYDNGNGTPSAKEYLEVLIDAHKIDTDDVDGYLTDNESDGTYDTFHNNEDDSDSDVDTENSSYLLDTDGDGEYDYKYDPNTGTGETIEDDTTDDDPASGSPEPAEEDNTLLYVGAGIVIILLLILLFLATRKKGKK